MGRKMTAQDVAREAGVSAATVDRVLNNRGGVSKDKERRVLAAARRLKLDRALDHRSARTLRVAAFLQPPANPFHAALRSAFVAQNKGANPFNIQTRLFYADLDAPAKTLARLRTAAADHDAIITCVPHDDDLARWLDHFAQGGKPVITLATHIRAARAVYVGPDNHRAGRAAGDLVGRLMGARGGDVLVLAGVLSMIGQAERRTGFEDVLAERYPNCRISGVLETHDDADRAGALVADALARSPAIGGIYNASTGAAAIAAAVARLGRTGDVVFVTHELTDRRRDLLRSGAIDAVLDQEPALEVDTALRAIAGHFGRADAPVVDLETPVRIYMRENC